MFLSILVHFWVIFVVVWTSVVLILVYITFRTSKSLFTGSYSIMCLDQDACKRLWQSQTCPQVFDLLASYIYKPIPAYYKQVLTLFLENVENQEVTIHIRDGGCMETRVRVLSRSIKSPMSFSDHFPLTSMANVMRSREDVKDNSYRFRKR